MARSPFRITVSAVGPGPPANFTQLALTAYDDFRKDAERELLEALKEAGDRLLETARSLAPRDTGALRASGRAIVDTSPGSGKHRIVLRFGGPDFPVPPTRNARNGIVDYAVIVHEDLDPRRINAYKEGGPRFMVRAAQQESGNMHQILLKHMANVAR